MKILILKPSSLGDVVQAIPVLRLVKRHFPQSEIYWWLSAELVPLLDGDSDLAGIIPFERRRWKSPWRWPEAVRSIRQMRARRFDWVIDLQSLARSGLVSWLAAGKFTVGLDDPREGARAFYDVVVPRPSFHTHAVDWYLQVLPALGVPVHWDFEWLPQREEISARWEERWGSAGGSWVLLNPGARWANKRWPVEYFCELGKRILKAYPETRLAILGGRDEVEVGAALTRIDAERCLNLAGQTTLPEMVEWIRRSEFLVTNDTGPMHVAAALRKPMAAIFGPTEPRRTGAYGQVEQALQASLPCVPCLKDYCSNPVSMECLRAVSPNQVFARVQRHFTGSADRAGLSS